MRNYLLSRASALRREGHLSCVCAGAVVTFGRLGGVFAADRRPVFHCERTLCADTPDLRVDTAGPSRALQNVAFPEHALTLTMSVWSGSWRGVSVGMNEKGR